MSFIYISSDIFSEIVTRPTLPHTAKLDHPPSGGSAPRTVEIDSSKADIRIHTLSNVNTPTRIDSQPQGVVLLSVFDAPTKDFSPSAALWSGYVPTRTSVPLEFKGGKMYLDSRPLISINDGPSQQRWMYIVIFLALAVVAIYYIHSREKKK